MDLFMFMFFLLLKFEPRNTTTLFSRNLLNRGGGCSRQLLAFWTTSSVGGKSRHLALGGSSNLGFRQTRSSKQREKRINNGGQQAKCLVSNWRDVKWINATRRNRAINVCVCMALGGGGLIARRFPEWQQDQFSVCCGSNLLCLLAGALILGCFM